MGSKPRIVIFSIIPRLGEIVRQLLPEANIKIVKFQEEEVAQLLDAEVLLADSNAFKQFSDRLPCLKWFQGTWAGVEGLVDHYRGKEPPSFLMSRMSSGAFNQLMAEYVVGQIISHERGWRLADKQQAMSQWHHSGTIASYRSLQDLTVGVLGTGQIGAEICRCLKAFRCRILGFSRTPPTQQQHSDIDTHYTGTSGLHELLSLSDCIVSCLPCTTHTTGLLDATALQHAKAGSLLINIGRGNVVKAEVLLSALDSGLLAGAVLDVFDQEPLPSDSRLWTHPKVVVTPHCAGVSRAQDVAATFLDNYTRYTAGLPLLHQINLDRGY